ncbi:unnamed protein product [Orchesella dallaii]|uniref:Catalase n=1 Tax=Orchesella dallaii TaxID=48710 RepID=A0ABP1RKD8_9HEXA
MGSRDKATNQLVDWQKKNEASERAVNAHGCPVASLTRSLTVGNTGYILLQDTNLVEHLAAFDRERIPERVVHAKGAGAFGYFEVQHDITKYTKARVFEKVGKRTPVSVRFSTVGGESGSADTARDPRGFAMKFYTEDGNWDLVGNNTPVFFIRDPILFPSFIHTQKRNPQTHLKDADMMWDFISLRPETLHQVCFLFSDRGTPDGYRHMNGYGSHTFKLVNKDGNAVYCKFHLKTDQGIKNLPAQRAKELEGQDPDYSIRDLHNSIAEGKFPSWSFCVQIMTFEQAEKYRWNPFDLTKVWPHTDFPLIPVGKFVLDRNPENYFNDVEQAAYSPANMVPGIEASPDKMLQGRLFSYTDTHRHRLGANYTQIPVNCPLASIKTTTYTRDGPMRVDNRQGGAPNYFPNSFDGPHECPSAVQTKFQLAGDVVRNDTGDEDNFSQVDLFWRKVLTPQERQRLVDNIAGSLKTTTESIRARALSNFSQVNEEFGTLLRAALSA